MTNNQIPRKVDGGRSLRFQKNPRCHCLIQHSKNKCRGGTEILIQDSLPLCTNVSLLSSLVSILDIQMSLLWIKAIQFGSAGQSLGSIRIFGQLVSTRMGLKGCCCLKEEKENSKQRKKTHTGTELDYQVSKITAVWMLTSDTQVYTKASHFQHTKMLCRYFIGINVLLSWLHRSHQDLFHQC